MQYLSQVLFSQGFGTRRDCVHMILAGRVAIGGQIITEPEALIETRHLVFTVDKVAWPFHVRALIMLHKPVGTECSQKPHQYPSVLRLLPTPLVTRGVQPIGRLDVDTTGLLLLTDDGALIHTLTSPKRHIPKIYEVQCAEPVTAAQLEQLTTGVTLINTTRPVRAAAVHATGPYSLQLTLTEGRYHQVKRMLAAVGNHVVALHRSAIGGLRLPADLAPGQWRWLNGTAAVLGATAQPLHTAGSNQVTQLA